MANLTLKIDDHLLKRARMTALRRDTSVNAMIRTYLEQISGEDQTDQGVREFLEIAEHAESGSGPGGRSWSRDELYDERVRPERQPARPQD